MSFSEKIARCTANASRRILRDAFHRDAANFPGKIGLYLDPSLISHAARNLEYGSICVVGTNGKTTTTNLIANALEAAGLSVCCNRTGANLDSDAQAFGQVISKTGYGNNDAKKTDGYLSGNLAGTYLHGPLLAKNPGLADTLLQRALDHWAARYNEPAPPLEPLDDTAELQANAFMAARLL